MNAVMVSPVTTRPETTVTMTVDGPFSLAAAASFGFGPRSGEAGAGVMRLAFVADDLSHQVGVLLRQAEPDGSLTAEITGTPDETAVERQVRRILSLDHPVDGWLAAGRADPVLGAVQAAHPGQRPVLFHSPYEAAAWAVLSHRRHRAQAAALRDRLAAATRRGFDLAGEQTWAFPLPEELLALDGFPGVEPVRLQRLHAIARAALDGQLDASRLAATPAAVALPALQSLPGLGPFYARLVYLRATGVTDALVDNEPLLAACLQHFYGLTEPPAGPAIERMATPWRPFRTWAAVLFRLAGERAGVVPHR